MSLCGEVVMYCSSSATPQLRAVRRACVTSVVYKRHFLDRNITTISVKITTPEYDLRNTSFEYPPQLLDFYQISHAEKFS